MNFEPTRKRREVAPFTINLLRLGGWRFSFTRAAWVHRIRRGRYGPVFVVRDDVTRAADPSDQTGFAVVTVAETAVAEAEAAVSAAAAAADAAKQAEPAASLPRRTPRTAEPTPADQTAAAPGPAPEPEPAEAVAAAESSAEDPPPPAGSWKVDGRPTLPRPRVNPTDLRSVSDTGKRASA